MRARGSALVAVVEVVDVMVVEVDGLLHQPKAEAAQAEIEIVLGVVDRRRDVMQAENRHEPMLNAKCPNAECRNDGTSTLSIQLKQH